MNAVGVDTETAGLYGEITRLGILHSKGKWYWLSLEEARKETHWIEEINNADAVVAHNVRYDATVMRRDLDFEFPWDKTHDTLVMAAMLKPGNAPKDLLTLSMEELDYDGKQDLDVEDYVEENNLGSAYHKIPDSILEPYTQRQLLNTLCLYKKYRNRMPEPAYDMYERRILKVLMDMEERGVKIDTDILEESKTKLDEEINKIQDEIYTMLDEWDVKLPDKYDGLFGVDLNLNSGDQVADILISKGVDLPETASSTDDNPKYSTAKSTLKAKAGDEPFIDRLLDLREAQKLKSTYVENLLGYADDNEVIHTNFTTTVTRTGRLSSRSPNLQNQAGHSESAKLIRQAFVPRDNYRNVEIDYSQMEFRFAVYTADDPVGKEEIDRGVDFHTAAASAIYGKDPDDITKDERSVGKTCNFSIVYGAGVSKVQRSLDIPRSTAERIINKWASHYQGIWNYKNILESNAKQNGYIELPYGRRLFIPEDLAYKSLNYACQGGTADIIKKAMVEVGDLLENKLSNQLIQIHDAIVIEEHKDEDVVGDVCDIMRNTSDFCPLDVDAELWDGSWANKIEIAPF